MEHAALVPSWYYPELSDQYLQIPEISVTPERAFSSFGNVYKAAIMSPAEDFAEANF